MQDPANYLLLDNINDNDFEIGNSAVRYGNLRRDVNLTYLPDHKLQMESIKKETIDYTSKSTSTLQCMVGNA